VDASFFISVPKALSFLYREGKPGHWIDIRTSSEAILALVATGESIHTQHVKCAAEYLIANFRTDGDGGSWGSELWDTALAIRALQNTPPYGQKIIDRAFAWIFTKQQPDGSFDGEPWDSLFICQAALESGKCERVFKTIEWLISLQTTDGVVISKHYSGLFCEVIGSALDLELPTAMRHKLRDAGIRALQFLWDNYSSDGLWGKGTWTNAYVVRGMLALRHPQVLEKCDDILQWYALRQAENGAWDDTVRTAIVIQALMRLGLASELDACSQKPLQALSEDLLRRSTREHLFQSISSKTEKTPVVRSKRLLDRDEDGNHVITLTPLRETYLAVIVSGLGVLWAIVLNWGFFRRLLFH